MERFQLSKDVKDVLNFLSSGGLYGYFWTQAKAGSYKISSWFPAGESRGFPSSWIENGWNVYFGLNPVNKVKSNTQRAELPDIASTRTFFAEFDVKDYGSKEEIIDHIENLKVGRNVPKPSLIVDSGGGYHCYWFLTDAVKIDMDNLVSIKCRLYGWISYVGGDDSSKDLCRVLRVPGTRNFKPEYGPDFPEVTIYDLDWDALYTIEQLCGIMQYDDSVECVDPVQEETIDVGDTRKRAYCLGGLDKECQRVTETRQGARNSTLFLAACSVGELIAVGGISEAEALTALIKAAESTGLTREESEKTINSGFKHGKTQPRRIEHSEAFQAETDYYNSTDIEPNYVEMLQAIDVETQVKAANVPPAPVEAIPEAGKTPSPETLQDWLMVKIEDLNFDQLNRFEASDEGNAQALIYIYRDRFAYNDSFEWLYFDGRKWESEGAYQKVRRAATETLYWRARAADYSASLTPKMFKQNTSLINSMVAQLETLVYVPPAKFDKMPYRINTLSGLVDLRTGKVEAHSPKHYLTHLIEHRYNPNADTTFFHNWLISACGEEQADWLQKICGHAVMGDPVEEMLMYIYGPSRSGKGTFSETIQLALGSPICREVKFSMFAEERNGDSQNFDLAELPASRFIFATEGKEHERLNAAKIKAITGGSEIMCSKKHRDPFWYKPHYIIFLSSNFLPNVSPDDEAAWGRLRLICFPNSHLGMEDKTLKRKMRTESNLEGVLLWLVQGAQKYLELGDKGLVELESSKQAKNSQASLLDNVGAWIDECTAVTGDEADFTSFTDLMESYLDWCKKNGATAKTSNGLSKSLERKRLILDKNATFTPHVKSITRPDKTRSTIRGYRGILLP